MVERYEGFKPAVGTVPEFITHAIDFCNREHRVLDLGCGNGRFGIYFAENGYNVTAIDNNTAVIDDLKKETERKGLQISTAVADMREINFEEPIGTMLAINSLHFMPKAEANQLIGKLKKATLEGGIHVVALLADENPEDGVRERYNRDELRHLYADWEIIQRWRMTGTRPDGSEQVQYAITARKPSSAQRELEWAWAQQNRR